MNLGLGGRTALILGGSKGLGRGIAEALAAEGAHLALVARGEAALQAAAEAITSRYPIPVHAIVADLADPTAALEAVSRAEAAFGRHIDILLNNTGGPPPGPVSGVDPETWQAQFQAMVLSVFRITDRVLPGMRRSKWGRILTVASTVVIEPNPALGISNTLRSALVGWSKTLAGEVACDGVTVNILLPGQIATDRTLFLDERAAREKSLTADEIRAAKVDQIPVGRYGTAAECGAVATFLASEQAAYVTGSSIRVDGGVLRSV